MENLKKERKELEKELEKITLQMFQLNDKKVEMLKRLEKIDNTLKSINDFFKVLSNKKNKKGYQ